ncbi:MAG: DUF3450 domain-containing protein [Deltaproteobacteria bacterium]|nr:DUF3450 domain-containing protein [Deltaproteobacteria bacterium]
MKRKDIYLKAGLWLGLCLSLGCPAPGFSETATRQHLEAGVTETLEIEQKTEAARQQWEVERQVLAERTHALELEEKLLAARLRKLDGYREQRLAEIARLEEGLARMADVGLRLEPFLDELVGRLERLRENDLPFALEERERRLEDLRESLDRYEVDLAEKLRRVMEVLRVEAGFGRGFEVGEETLSLAGVETTVRVLRLGRVALYYLTLDGRQAGWYNQKLKGWQPLPAAAGEAVKEALRMALKQRAFDLVRLPVTAEEKP